MKLGIYWYNSVDSNKAIGYFETNRCIVTKQFPILHDIVEASICFLRAVPFEDETKSIGCEDYLQCNVDGFNWKARRKWTNEWLNRTSSVQIKVDSISTSISSFGKSIFCWAPSCLKISLLLTKRKDDFERNGDEWLAISNRQHWWSQREFSLNWILWHFRMDMKF